jgi:hypothetical protein
MRHVSTLESKYQDPEKNGIAHIALKHLQDTGIKRQILEKSINE